MSVHEFGWFTIFWFAGKGAIVIVGMRRMCCLVVVMNGIGSKDPKPKLLLALQLKMIIIDYRVQIDILYGIVKIWSKVGQT